MFVLGMTSTSQEHSVKHHPEQQSSVIDDKPYKKYDRVEAYDVKTTYTKPPLMMPEFQSTASIYQHTQQELCCDRKIGKRKIDSDIDIIKNQEPCPLIDSNITSELFTCNGGTMVIEDCNLKVNVPSGAIEDHHKVEFQVAASLFGPYNIPNDCHPVSLYVWIGANYTFKKPIELNFEHHADFAKSKDTSQFCVLKGCCNSHHLNMSKMTQGYDISDSTCTLYTNHFCSYCLAAKSIQIPDRIVAYHYLPYNYMSVDEFIAEICFCYDLNICKKVCNQSNLINDE